jgi:two-component system LytT family response regulator
MVYKAIIVDDERLARKEMNSLLAEFPQVKVVGEAENLGQAEELIKKQKPDVAFLDIQLGGESGFDLLDKINGGIKVIFVTAFDAYAIRAFDVNAIDYLLKPVNPDRLAIAIERLGEKRNEPIEIRALQFDDRIFLDLGERSLFLKVGDISHISSSGDYSSVSTVRGVKLLVEKPLREWEMRLPAKHFLRIHRQAIINLEEIEEITPWFNRTFQVRLKNFKETLSVSRRHSAQLKNRFA